MGATVGGITGLAMPQLSGVAGSYAGGALAGAVSGMYGGGAGSFVTSLANPNNSANDILYNTGKGMLAGATSGAAGGLYKTGALSLRVNAAVTDLGSGALSFSIENCFIPGSHE
ncbi:hypothetical protein [Desulfogranum marinum]|uniref:hypothetical protein n=1 Tax=Desulfogranum marinum TaxID=453220 RepID=UPI0029C9A612|nr:hypothetical protein [Desulfogranum marinum]